MLAAEVDELDLKLIQALQLDGRAPASRIAVVLGVSDQTVARRIRKLRMTANLRVVGVVDETRLGGSGWIVRLCCAPGVADQVAAALARRQDTSYVALVSGGAEVICLMKPRDRRERDELLLDRLRRTPRVTSVSASCLLHHYFDGSRGTVSKIAVLTPEQKGALRPPAVRSATDYPVLDAADETLLAALSQDGRATLAELRSVSDLSEDQVRRRLEHLRRNGVLYFDVQFDLAPFGREVTALLWLTVAPSALGQVGKALAEHGQVTCAAAVSGRANIFACAYFRKVNEFYDYLSEQIGVLEGVHQVETDVELRRVKHFTYDPRGSSGSVGQPSGAAMLLRPSATDDLGRMAAGAGGRR